MTTKGLISKAIGTIGMALCEIFDDSNKIYQSYYFYLDGSEQNGYAYKGLCSSGNLREKSKIRHYKKEQKNKKN